tara:strand:+ start:44 stop:406 length:363 start_codon:yes stop_codon:yes gene_type:complete
MKKALLLVLIVFIFTASFLYLNQKIQIYAEAYRLHNSYYKYNELADKRDYLMHSFSKQVSLAQINQWALAQNFSLVDRERVIALNPKPKKQIVKNRIAVLLDNFLSTSTAASAALAKEKR